MKKVLIVCLSIMLLCGFAACIGSGIKEKSFNNIQNVYQEFTLDNITEITAVNGTTGEKISFTESSQIQEIFGSFAKLSIKDTEQPKEDSGGYTYNIRFYNGDDRVLRIVYGGVTDTLSINGHLYIVEDMSVIQSTIDYFDEYKDKA